MNTGAIEKTVIPLRVHPFWPALGPVLVALAYYAGAKIAFAIGTLTHEFAPFWPPNVVLLCAFLLTPRRHWPLYIAAVFPAHVLAEHGVAMPLPQLLGAFASNVSVALLNAAVLIRLVRGPPWLGSLHNALLYLLFAVVVNPALVALVAGFEPALVSGDLQGYWQFWYRWYLANALGNLTLTPVFLTWLWNDSGLPSMVLDRRRVAEEILLAVGLVLGCLLACDTNSTRFGAGLFPALSYLPVPLLLAAAVRFGSKGASAAILIVTVEVLVLAMRGHAPFAGVPSGSGVLSIQLFLTVIAAPVILLAALIEELQRTNGRLSAVLDGISDCYYTLDHDGRITGLNAKAASWWGARSPEALIGRYYREVTGEQGPEPSWARRTIEGGVPVREEMLASNGRWIDVSAYPAPRGLNVFYHDVTERKAAEQAARATRDLLQSSLDALSAHIAILDTAGTIIAVNAAWQKTAELTARIGEHYFVGANYFEECERGRPQQRMIAAGLRRMMRNELDEFRFEFASGIVAGAWFQLRGTRFGAGAELRLVLAFEDITEVKAAEAALRRLTGELLRLQDEERRRIARELHDSTAQNLLGAALGIGQALRLSPRLKPTARAILEESRSLIDQSQHEIRTVSYLLHPPMLDEAGLPAALRWFCEGFAKRTGIWVSLNIAPGIDRLPAELEAALFRIVQEGLTNVHRHSGSGTARVELRPSMPPETRPIILLTIADDGRGMPADFAEAPGCGRSAHDARKIGIGLAGMLERLHQLGGDLQILSSPRGTTLRVTAPLPADAASARDAGA